MREGLYEEKEKARIITLPFQGRRGRGAPAEASKESNFQIFLKE